MARLVLEGLPTARLLSAQVFHEALDASVADVAQAIAWLAAQRVDVINMSFGLRARSPALEAACRQAHEACVLLVASAPARGGAVYPAAFESCIAVSDDARCRAGEVSWLGLQGAGFGTHPFLERDSAARGGGASYAAARFSGLVGALLARGVPAPEVGRNCICGPPGWGRRSGMREDPMEHADIAILGVGPAALALAIALRRLGLSPLVIGRRVRNLPSKGCPTASRRGCSSWAAARPWGCWARRGGGCRAGPGRGWR